MTNRSQPSAGALGHFLYRSLARENLAQDDIDQILRESRRRNSELGLTGCLHVEDGLFFQWLEGPADALEQVVELILKDPRHTDIVQLSSGPLAARQFSNWTMRGSNRSHASLMDWVASRNVSTLDRGAYSGVIASFLAAIVV